MKKILFIGGKVRPMPSANTVCVQNILRGLQVNYKVYFLGLGEREETFESEGVIYKLIAPIESVKGVRRRISIVMNINQLPDTQPNITAVKTEKALNWHDLEEFDAVVGICSNYSNIFSALNVKKTDPNVKVIGFYMDTIESLSNLSGALRKLRDKYSYAGEKKVFSELDAMMLPLSSKYIYDKQEFSNYKDKICYFEFPTFIPSNAKKTKNCCNSGEIILTIVGSLNKTFRNPQIMFERLNSAVNLIEENVVVNVYGSASSDYFLPLMNNPKINCVFHGKVAHEEIEQAYLNTDALINISNSNILAVPSKIFEMFSTYKPIITYISNTRDSSYNYYLQYEACYIVNGDDKHYSDEMLADYLRKLRDIEVDVDSVNKNFAANSPDYVAGQLINILNVDK